MFHVKQFNKLAEFCIKNDIEYNDVTDDLFVKFCDFLIEKNKVMNLTAVTDPKDIEIKHFIDSISSIPTINKLFKSKSDQKSVEIIDIGTGAGFPGMPLAIMMPQYQFTLADSLNKRIDFLKETVSLLKITNVIPIQGRADELGQGDFRESFDLCVSRAVADMSVLLEYCLPLVKVGGYVLLYKSGDYKEELQKSEYAMELLGGKLIGVKEFSLPDTDMRRSLIQIEKINETPYKYPRRPGKPSKSPLIK